MPVDTGSGCEKEKRGCLAARGALLISTCAQRAAKGRKVTAVCWARTVCAETSLAAAWPRAGSVSARGAILREEGTYVRRETAARGRGSQSKSFAQRAVVHQAPRRAVRVG